MKKIANKGVLNVSIEAVEDILLLPDGMNVLGFHHIPAEGIVQIMVEHPDIPTADKGQGLPEIMLEYQSQRQLILKRWFVVGQDDETES